MSSVGYLILYIYGRVAGEPYASGPLIAAHFTVDSGAINIADSSNSIAKRTNNDRLKRLIKIQLSNDRIHRVDAILRNVTEKGAGIELQVELQPGEQVLITMKNVEPFFSRVAWWNNNRAGLEFDGIIDPSLLTVRTNSGIEGEGLFRSPKGFHVFDRFKPTSEPKRPALKPRKLG